MATILGMDTDIAPDTPLGRHLETRGNGSKIARAAKVSTSAVFQWARTRVPAERVLTVAEVSGIPPHDLRPDIYPADVRV